MILDPTNCILGEGPLWHPERNEFFWFDIVQKRLHSETRVYDLPFHASAAGWVDRDTLLIASEVGLHRFNLADGSFSDIVPLEAELSTNRSNDGRADPMGGFWIGTMSKTEEARQGSFYRYYKGELRMLWPGITVPNAQCFAPDGRTVYFSDTPTHRVMAAPLDEEGWPDGRPSVALDFSDEGLYPDGACTDAAGNIWIAFWGKGRVDGFTPTGKLIRSFDFPCPQTTCPAFGGAGYNRLLCTSAARDLSDGNPDNGRTFVLDTDLTGRPEPRVLL
jgi:sugar lactone lactonase YvrE